ncbi:uncharacterized protein LOC107017578 [Solanum pennellii]|uniref:Uncharacterized protein LOC107017578 n=1 Tax=Solanum pennellii TaxID=28526 RepID=A0ABM1GME1_SOLPN|nr:uncharacterized protein LOC107017578 [Solanum pennellii]
MEHENQNSYDVIDDKEIHSVFPSRMKKNVVLPIRTDSFLKVKRSPIVVTNQFHGENKKDKDKAITVFVGSETCSNNTAEYETLIVGLEMKSDMQIPKLDVCGDSQLIINKLSGSYEKVVAKNRRDWHERVGEALWEYRTTIRTTTQATLFSLVYGVEAVLPLEKQIPSLRIVFQEELTTESNAPLRQVELEAFDENTLEAQQSWSVIKIDLQEYSKKKCNLDHLE